MSELRLVENMRELRTINKYSQKNVSDLIHISRQTYSVYETGKRLPDLKTVCALASLYRISVDALLYMNFTDDLIAESDARQHTALGPGSSAIRLDGTDTKMLTNYKELPPDEQWEVREIIRLKKKKLTNKEN